MGRGKKDSHKDNNREKDQEKSRGKEKLQLPLRQSAHGYQEPPCGYKYIPEKSRVSGL